MSPTRRLTSLFAAGSTLALLGCAFAASRTPPKADVALQVANDLDAIVQPRFQKDASFFGVSRILTMNGHERVARFDAQIPAEAQLLQSAQSMHHDYVIAFLHCAHVPAQSPGMSPLPRFDVNGVTNATDISLPTPKPVLTLLDVRQAALMKPVVPTALKWTPGTAEPYYRSMRLYFEKPATSALPRLGQQPEVRITQDNWLVVMRPVRATQVSCLGCHVGAKIGDTLGVMVYAVSKTASKS